MKAAGYKTHLQVLAVPYRWSWLGIHTRFEAVKARKGFARTVSEADHDDRFSRLQQSLPIVVTSPHLDKILVYQRQLSVAPDSPVAITLVTEDKEKVVQAFFDIRKKPIDEQERIFFECECAKVVGYMQDREAPLTQITAFEEKARKLASS